MTKYLVRSNVSLSCYTEIDADTPEEAMKKLHDNPKLLDINGSNGTDITGFEYGVDWCSEESDEDCEKQYWYGDYE